MKNIILGTFLTLFAFAAQAQTSADEIIAKHVEAMGSAKMAELKSMKMEAKVSVQQAPGMEIPITISIINNKCARIDVSVMGMQQITCINGDEGWGNNPFMGKTEPEPLTKDQVVSMKEMTDLSGSFYDYKKKGYTAEYLGKEDLEGTEVHKIKLVKGPTKTEYAFIDPENFYQIKSIEIDMVDGKEVSEETVFSNFKTVDGLTFPYTMEQNNPMMGASVTTFTNIALNPELDEAMFKMPKK